MAERSQAARDEALLVTVQAEARSVVFASVASSLLPYGLGAAALTCALTGHESTAVMTALGAIAAAAPRVIEALRSKK